MDDLSFLRARIASYADYSDRDARHLVDKQVRAWAGEALAAARERLQPADPALAELADRVIWRCEFTDQRVIHAVDHGVFADPALVERIHALDREIVESVEGSDRLDTAAFAALLARIDQLFDARAAALEASPPRP